MGIIDKSQTKGAVEKFFVSAGPPSMMIILVLTSFAVYFNALFNGFVWDDKYQVLNNLWIRDVKNIPAIFSESAWGFTKYAPYSNYYRPFMHITYMIDYHLFGLRPWGFHLVNILFHAGNSILVFVTTSRLLGESRPSTASAPLLSDTGKDCPLIPAFMAAMLFAVHPIHTEAVTWVACLSEVAFTFFYLLSFYLYLRSGGELKGNYLFSVASFFVAVLFKEPAVTLPIILVGYDIASGKGQPLRPANLRKYIPYLAVAGGYFLMRHHAIGGFAPHEEHADLSTFQLIINVFPLICQYLEKLLIPVDLNAFHVFHPVLSLFEAKSILSLLITAFLVFLFLVALKKNKAAFTGLLFVIVPLLPVLYIPALGSNTLAERYLYLPSCGFAILLALLIRWILANRPAMTTGLTVCFVILTGLYAAGTAGRNGVWKDDYTLYRDMVEKSPDGAPPHYFLGNFFMRKGEPDRAIEQYRITLSLDPTHGYAHNNLGIVYGQKGLLDLAIEEYRTALALNPDFIEARYNLGLACVAKGLWDQAIEQFQIAVELDPTNPDFRGNLAKAVMLKARSSGL